MSTENPQTKSIDLDATQDTRRGNELLKKANQYRRYTEMEAFNKDSDDEELARHLSNELRARKAAFRYGGHRTIEVGSKYDEMLDDGETSEDELLEEFDKDIAQLNPEHGRDDGIMFGPDVLAKLATYRREVAIKIADRAFLPGNDEETEFYRALARKKILGEL